MFADESKEALPKRRIWVNIESLVFVKELSISLTVLKRVSLWLVNKGSKEKNAYLFQDQGHKNKMDLKYLESNVWIYAHASDLDQDVVLWGIWFLCIYNN